MYCYREMSLSICACSHVSSLNYKYSGVVSNCFNTPLPSKSNFYTKFTHFRGLTTANVLSIWFTVYFLMPACQFSVLSSLCCLLVRIGRHNVPNAIIKITMFFTGNKIQLSAKQPGFENLIE